MARADSTPGEVLSDRALNRALLQRQLLLRREEIGVFEVIDRLVGLQAQVPRDPYLALWSRIQDFAPDALESLLLERRVARSPLLRSTIHLSTAQDCLALRPLAQPLLTRVLKNAFGRRLEGADLDALAAEGAAIFAKEPVTFAGLRRQLGERWSGDDDQALGYAVSYLVPLVQVPPRGLWTKTSLPTWTTTEAWFGRPMQPDAPLDQVVLRYLAAFGPASAADIRTWCGIASLRETVDRLRQQLVSFRDEGGRELLDLPEAPRPDPETPAPVRFLPQYDNVFLSHAERGRIVSAANKAGTQLANGFANCLLVDGFIRGLWKLVLDRRAATLRVQPLDAWTDAERNAVGEEAERLLAFIAADASSRDVEFTEQLWGVAPR